MSSSVRGRAATRSRKPAPAPDADLRSARRVLEIEARAVAALAARLGPEFSRAVDVLAACSGKVVVSGLGKSGIICRKIAATFASTGTPALFLHAVEGLHGDIGMLAREDVLLAVSNSGKNGEILALMAPARRLGVPVVVLTGDPSSPLARGADVALDASVAEEACPLGLAPTASTTATLALGDALAIALLERRGFSTSDFATLHPAGALGRRFLRVDELMHAGDEVPLVAIDTPMPEALQEMSRKRLGLTGVVDGDRRLAGILTDGDLRRGIERHGDLRGYRAGDVMTARPKTVPGSALAERALAQMEQHSITSLFIVDDDGRPAGVLHLHDLLRAGVV
ncbi:MAG TPA: KpsF/GutQ family sugar-phosphate isomerase [Candidatus Binatia bacterium]|nr:KpsF/GutQ family sugar-phosphate isomerase [Candidatus Binatia bacterium]